MYNGAQKKFKIQDGTEFEVWDVLVEFLSNSTEYKTPDTLVVEYCRKVEENSESPFKAVIEAGKPVLATIRFSTFESQNRLYNSSRLYRVMRVEV